MARSVTRNEGMFVGYTSGAAVQATIQLLNEDYFNQDSKVVIIFPDHGSRYMSKIYSEDWMEKQGFFDSDHESHQQIEYVNELNEKMKDLFDRIHENKGPLGKWASQAEGYFVFPKLEGPISNRMKFKGKGL